MKTGDTERKRSILSSTFLAIGLFWTVFIAALLAWTVTIEKDKTTEMSLMQARSFFQFIVATRYWNSAHGGVYVAVTPENQPNPYLDVPHRDVTTADGRALTLINPAYMTRQIAEIARKRNQVLFHITSLRPIRPANAPEGWEAAALGTFSGRMDEHHEWWLPAVREERAFRYIAPLWTEKTCLPCHAKQGYVEGDLRGGISVTIPADHILSEQDGRIRLIVLRYLLIWTIGILGIGISFRLTVREYRERSHLIDRLEHALGEIKTLEGLIPICASCKKVRNDEGYWEQIEKYIGMHSGAEFTHGICPDCLRKLYPEVADEIEREARERARDGEPRDRGGSDPGKG